MTELEVVSRKELMEAVSRSQQQRTKLQKAQLAIDDRRVPVLEHAVAMVHREYEVDVNDAAIDFPWCKHIAHSQSRCS